MGINKKLLCGKHPNRTYARKNRVAIHVGNPENGFAQRYPSVKDNAAKHILLHCPLSIVRLYQCGGVPARMPRFCAHWIKHPSRICRYQLQPDPFRHRWAPDYMRLIKLLKAVKHFFHRPRCLEGSANLRIPLKIGNWAPILWRICNQSMSI